MKNNITSLEIKNFKSIKHLKTDCKRINVLIGEPNVGKSNILEALSLYLAEVCDHSKPFLSDYIRYEELSNLFYDQDRKNIISVISDIGAAYFRFHLNSTNKYDVTLLPPYPDAQKFYEVVFDKELSIHTIKNNFYALAKNTLCAYNFPVKPFYSPTQEQENNPFEPDSNTTTLEYNSPVKKYTFKSLPRHKSHYSLLLRPPYGDNLYTIFESNSKIYEEAAMFFLKYKLDLLLDMKNKELEVQKRVNNRVYQIPYSLAADTLQRIIFHLSAIETNTDSILLFEEPEAHSFPPYISMIAERIIMNKENQFFIATHSPYLLTPFIEQCPKEEISIFICRYENYETKVRALTDKEIGEIMQLGIDPYFNISAFQE